MCYRNDAQSAELTSNVGDRGKVWVKDVVCDTDDHRLADCTFTWGDDSGCDANTNVGIECTGQYNIFSDVFSLYISF